MKSIILLIKGFFIGVANIIPGVSGGTLAITLGIYEKLISTISHIFKNFKENIKFLLPIGIGAVLSLLCLSKVIKFTLTNYTLITILFFVGAILGGLPMLYKKVKSNIKVSNILIFVLMFALVLGLTFLGSGKDVSLTSLQLFDYLKLFLLGIVASATMVIPGISGSAMLMTLGYYYPIINTISDLTNFSNLTNNLLILMPFGIGIVVGILLIAKVIEFLLKKCETKTYFAIIGFVLASVIVIFIESNIVSFTILDIIFGIILFLIGFIIAYKLGDK